MAGARYPTKSGMGGAYKWALGGLAAAALAVGIGVRSCDSDKVQSGAFDIPTHECVSHEWDTHIVSQGDRLDDIAKSVRNDYVAEARECGINPHKRDHNYQTWLERIREANPALAEKIYIHPGDEIRHPNFECNCGDEADSGQ